MRNVEWGMNGPETVRVSFYGMRNEKCGMRNESAQKAERGVLS
jgi:hypothetical protein